MTVLCNRCGKYFSILKEGIMVLSKDGYDVTYYECPHCKEKYLVCIFDDKMRELVDRRRTLEQILRIAKTKRFRKEAIRKHLKEYENVKAEQKALEKELKPIGMDILNDIGKGEDEDGEHHSD